MFDHKQKRRSPRRFAQLNKSNRLARRNGRESEFIVNARGVDFRRAMYVEAQREQHLAQFRK